MLLRMGQPRCAGLLAILCAALVGGGCRTSPAVDLSWTVEHRPFAGAPGADAHVTIVMRDRALGQPVRGARLSLEGHMSHPGMAPVVAAVSETTDGRYEGQLRMTMAGDWTLVLSGALADGRRVTWQRQIEISGAAPAS